MASCNPDSPMPMKRKADEMEVATGKMTVLVTGAAGYIGS